MSDHTYLTPESLSIIGSCSPTSPIAIAVHRIIADLAAVRDELKAAQDRIAELEKDRAELRTAAIRFINEAPREGDFAIMMLGLSGTAKPEHRPMIDAYSAARRELYGLLAAGTAVND